MALWLVIKSVAKNWWCGVILKLISFLELAAHYIAVQTFFHAIQLMTYGLYLLWNSHAKALCVFIEAMTKSYLVFRYLPTEYPISLIWWIKPSAMSNDIYFALAYSLSRVHSIASSLAFTICVLKKSTLNLYGRKCCDVPLCVGFLPENRHCNAHKKLELHLHKRGPKTFNLDFFLSFTSVFLPVRNKARETK